MTLNFNYKKWIGPLLIILVLIGLDQLSKSLIVNLTEYRESIPVIENFFYITHHYNEGAAWGILQGETWFFYLTTFFALGIFGYFAKDLSFKDKKWYSIAVLLLIAGAIGNFIDRVLFGHVIDFIDVYIFTYDYPIFNFADSYLTVGMIIFAMDLLVLEPRREKNV